MDATVAMLRDCGFPQVKLDGYTDLSGTDAYNQALSIRRAGAVRRRATVLVSVPKCRGVRARSMGREEPRASARHAQGHLLWHGTIDDRPQLCNASKGHLSFAGPRPPSPDEVRPCERGKRPRLRDADGIPGIGRVSGRTQVSGRDSMRPDVRYVACRDCGSDVRLPMSALALVTLGRGAR